MDDAYLNHYADRYVAGRLRAHGVSLDQYLADPQRYEALALEPEPLLPAQQAVARRIAAEHADLVAELEADLTDAARLAGGALVEPLHHHRRPRKPGERRRFFRPWPVADDDRGAA